MGFEKSLALQPRFNRLIPGGCHTYAKGDDQYPESMPPYIVRGEGCRVWDADGNVFIEYGAGLRSVTLGHAYPSVVEAARRQLGHGANFVRPAVIELEAAEALLGFVPGADMVKFAKDGSDATSGAVRLARACTGRDIVGVCAQHPFFSVDDWFIGSTLMPAGVPAAVRRLTVKFDYNDLDSARRLFADHPGAVACLVLEAERDVPPAPGYLAGLQALCRDQGALLIFDEMVTGFRWANGGAQEVHGVVPDLATFGKAMGNGFAIAALVGRREIMELGAGDHDRDQVFLISTTHGAETHALAAMMATLEVYRSEPVIDTLYRRGTMLAEGVADAAARRGLERCFTLSGRPCCLFYQTRDRDGRPSQALRTLFLAETLKRGVMMPSLVIGYSHTEADVALTVEAIAGALDVYRRALDEGVDRHLVGRPVRPVFRTRP